MPQQSSPLDVTRIYYEPAAAELPRGRQVLDRWPDAVRVPVDSHWRIPELHGDETNVDRWVRIKREALVLGIKKSLAARPNGRSADFIAPSTANGCAMACAYCYVPRRKGYSNPITVFAIIEQITGYLRRHVGRQGSKADRTSATRTAGSTTSARTATVRSTRRSATTSTTSWPCSVTCRRPRRPSPPSTSTPGC